MGQTTAMGESGWRRLTGWLARVTGQGGDDRWAVYDRARRDPPGPGPERERVIGELILERQRHKHHRDVKAYDDLIRDLRQGGATEKRGG